ncbi:unnamed protein product, partial [Staurois parvus]
HRWTPIKEKKPLSNDQEKWEAPEFQVLLQKLSGVILKADCCASEMRKNSIVTCCVTFCLLSAFPGNQGATLLESLSCVQPYPLELLNCTWVENNFLENLVTMTLKELDKNESACQE